MGGQWGINLQYAIQPSCDLSVGCSLGVSPRGIGGATMPAAEAPNEHP